MSPAAMLLQLVNLIPGIKMLPFMHSIFTYLSSVQVYQERRSSQTGTLVDFDQTRRISIQRRMANLIVTMALNTRDGDKGPPDGYDRWYICGHSLGSVIALKALMYDGVAFARFMSHRRWYDGSLNRLKPDPKTVGEDDAGSAAVAWCDYPDCPKRPHWLPSEAALDIAKIFKQLHGLVTYGSPLEMFAKTWPAIVQFNSELTLSPDFRWINFYDPTDLVAPRVDSFNGAGTPQRYPIAVNNVAVSSSYLIGRSHTNYLSFTDKNWRERIIFPLAEWMLTGAEPTRFIEAARDGGMAEDHIFRRRAMLALQTFFVFLLGGLLWPVATLTLVGSLQLALSGILRFLSNVVPIGSDWLEQTSNQLFQWARGLLSVLSITQDWQADLIHLALSYGIMMGVITAASYTHYRLETLRDRNDAKREQEERLMAKRVPIRVAPRTVVLPSFDE
jgi:hypothetical protein